MITATPDGYARSIARVTGMPGDAYWAPSKDLVRLHPGQLWLSASDAVEPADGHVAVDSETCGPVPRALVKGVAYAHGSLWPPSLRLLTAEDALPLA